MRALVLPSLMFAAFCASNCSARPKGVEGPDAEKLTDRMIAGAQMDLWNSKTAAVSFDFRGKYQIFWDKKRNLAEVISSGTRVQYNTLTGKSACFENDHIVFGDKCALLMKDAVKKFVNGTYWLSPAFHARSPGARRMLVDDTRLLIDYPSGGVTPGDAFMFSLDNEGKIANMQTWASTIPIKGSNIPFSGYITTATGVKVATKHKVLKFVNVNLDHVKMYAVYPEPGEPDRFVDLLGPDS